MMDSSSEYNGSSSLADTQPQFQIFQSGSARYVPVLEYVPLANIVSARTSRNELDTHPLRSGEDTNDGSGNIQNHGKVSRDGVVADSQVGVDLEGLARSIGSEHEPRLAEPPVVEEQPDGRYRLCAGERRVAAARLAGWRSIPCLVYPTMDPMYAYTLGLLQNAHHAALHPLDEMSAMCISRLLANLNARSMGSEARQILLRARQDGSSNYAVMGELQSLLSSSGWIAARPDVTWKAHLDDLGISMAPWERKRKLRILNIEPDLQERLRTLDITEAALRSLGTLEPDDQRKVVFALEQNPLLARKVRRVARSRRSGFYSNIEDALAEVQGLPDDSSGRAFMLSAPSIFEHASDVSNDLRTQQHLASQSEIASGAEQAYPTRMDDLAVPRSKHAYLPSADVEDEQADPTDRALPSNDYQAGSTLPTSNDQKWVPRTHFSRESEHLDVPAPVQDAVLQLLECADKLSSAVKSLDSYGGGSVLPDPWRGWWQNATEFIEAALNSDAHR